MIWGTPLIAVVAVDVSRFVNIGLGFGMYVTPIIYSPDSITNPLALLIIKWNPLTYLVCSARDVLIYGHLYQHNTLAYFVAAGVSFLAFTIRPMTRLSSSRWKSRNFSSETASNQFE